MIRGIDGQGLVESVPGKHPPVASVAHRVHGLQGERARIAAELGDLHLHLVAGDGEARSREHGHLFGAEQVAQTGGQAGADLFVERPGPEVPGRGAQSTVRPADEQPPLLQLRRQPHRQDQDHLREVGEVGGQPLLAGGLQGVEGDRAGRPGRRQTGGEQQRREQQWRGVADKAQVHGSSLPWPNSRALGFCCR